jgi:hypothetical protein
MQQATGGKTPLQMSQTIGKPSLSNNIFSSNMSGRKQGVTTTKSASTTKQQKSPELEGLMAEMTKAINSLGANTQQAYNTKQGTYTDVINQFANTMGAAQSGAQNAASANAIASGLSPVEAGGMANDANLNVLAQYFPQLAQFNTQQADVGIDLQQALASQLSGLSMPLLQGTQAPYWQGVAGQTQSGTQTVDDPLSAMMAQFQMKMASQPQQQTINPIDLLKLQQNAQQFEQDYALKQAGMGQDWQKVLLQSELQQQMQDKQLGSQFGLADVNNASDWQRALLQAATTMGEGRAGREADYARSMDVANVNNMGDLQRVMTNALLNMQMAEATGKTSPTFGPDEFDDEAVFNTYFG